MIDKKGTWFIGKIRICIDNDGYVFAGTSGDGVRKSKEILTGVVDRSPFPAKTNNIFIYPNPVINSININLGSLISKNLSIEIFRQDGNQIYKNTFEECEGKITIDASSIISGLYYCKIGSGNLINNIPFVISR